jgi:spore photoproduct lyase
VNRFIIATNRGHFIKPCPGTPRHVCCGYRIINFAQGCTLGCTYCILDSYFNHNIPVVFENRSQLLAELDEVLVEETGLLRLGTGEFTDSLLFEKSYPLYERLIPRIAASSHAILEIKTKTVQVDSLLDIRCRDHIIVSWSLNSKAVARREERGAPDIDTRIRAAKKVEDCGYKLAFHFDPIIHHEGWEDGYGETIERLFKVIDPRDVVYVSMGALRFVPRMKQIMEAHGAQYLDGDFVRGEDNKMRYFRPLRTRMYRTLLAALKEYVPEQKVYLCMENRDVWKDVFGIESMSSKLLAERLDRACKNAFPTLVI